MPRIVVERNTTVLDIFLAGAVRFLIKERY